MTLAEAAALAHATAANRSRPAASFGSSATGKGGDGSDGRPKPKSLVEVHAEQKASAKQKNAKADWEGHHPWKPFDRDTDLDIRAAKPKSKETILNNEFMGTLGDRFGSGRREHTFM